MKSTRQILLVMLLLLTPLSAYANAGTPLMWASAFHLVIGNALIGALEGFLLSWIFKTPRSKSIYTLIVANYVSAWAGMVLVANKFWIAPDLTIENFHLWFILFLIIVFVVTLLIEYPFVWFTLKSNPKPVFLSVVATLLINGISYVFLISWYWLASGTSMVTKQEVVSPTEIHGNGEYALYYIPPEGDRVLKTDLLGNNIEIVKNISSTSFNDRLFVRKDTEGNFDLCIYLHPDKGEELIKNNFSALAPKEPHLDGDSDKIMETWMSYGKAPSIALTSDWEFRTELFVNGGIGGENKKANQSFHYTLETPIAWWMACNATQIEGDYVVFQLGDDQICILDPIKKKIALIVRGRGPIVAKKTPMPPAQ